MEYEASLPDGCRLLLRSLVRIGAPQICLQLVCCAYLSGLVDGTCDLDACELFAGDQAISKGLRRFGLSAFAYEIKHDGVTQDFMSRTGYCLALAAVLRLRPGSLLWMGIVCSSWVWISRSSTGRDAACVLGNASQTVRTANTMVSRAVILIYVAAAKGIVVVLEQPSSSLLYLHPRFQSMLAVVPMFKSLHWLGLFGAESSKPIVLYCNARFMSAVNNLKLRAWLPVSEGVTRHVTDPVTGESRCYGSVNLKATQSYPDHFGFAVARVWTLHRQQVAHAAEQLLLDAAHTTIAWDAVMCDVDDPWTDACLEPVFAALWELGSA